ncbi:hypothetical protein E2C01_036307 [Portunus trituberculatus]|uniref:Uncharacterized protein n=1 Tax=Portunus trituberculatus TaxID=210409 RepID=A0A5B7F5G2_PORTR|nr:hypothetical protein [Portunus trituberculatus]
MSSTSVLTTRLTNILAVAGVSCQSEGGQANSPSHPDTLILPFADPPSLATLFVIVPR